MDRRMRLGPHSVQFSKVELCLITGLKFEVIPDTMRYEMVQNRIHQPYFSGVTEVDYEQLRAVLRIGIFEQQYDAVKLCLLYMLNWILIGLDEREKVPLWQIRLVEDLDVFDAFMWGAHVYRQSIFGFKHALDGRRERYERRQQEKGADIHMVETYNIYGLAQALLMFARTELVPTVAERVARYYEGIYEGGSLYTVTDRHDGSVPDPLHHTTARPSHMEGSDLEFGGGSPLKHRPDTEGSNPEFVGGSPLRRRQSDEEWDKQYREVMNFLQGRRGSISQSDRDGPPSHDRDSPRRDRDDWHSHDGGTDPATGPATEGDEPQTQGPGAGDTVREQQMQVSGGTDTGVFEETVT
ncbi:hypothetical protein Dsin_012338 [Dipteronia sinensis]|uniref:DUF1985 domain-containing protein n=1 Tax=Dipteronia sinensis TaxID=43782 RepID=A0AAE0AHT2_9ROSI|nr:hypothetical protein Dsin_012338 [Dipteronia sinensis]